MYEKIIEFEQLKSTRYPEGKHPLKDVQLGIDNRVYRSLQRLFDLFIFGRPHKELFLVGGCVRDLLLGREPKDYDLCTDATPDEVKQICASANLRTYDSGIKHGTLTIIDDFFGVNYEITTYRVDGSYSDGRHPDSVAFTPSLEEDLKRRDFTINSFAYNFISHKLICLDESYLDDLEAGVIRCVGLPAERFSEDALRMLRALRFAAQLNFSIDSCTYHAIETAAPLLGKVSKERIRDELTKILLSDRPEMLKLFAFSGLEKYAFDGKTPLRDVLDCPHDNPRHYADVFHHTMDVVKGVPQTFELRWAALFHDLGKPSVKAQKEGIPGVYSYHGHSDVSASIAKELMELLRFPLDETRTIYEFVKHHDDLLVDMRDSKFKRLIDEIGKDKFLDFLKLRAADTFAHDLAKGVDFAIDNLSADKERFMKIVRMKEPLNIADLVVDGYDLMDLGLAGKQIGDCLRYLTEAVLEDASKNNIKTLLDMARVWRDQNGKNQ